jgi:hypothetical protein
MKMVMMGIKEYSFDTVSKKPTYVNEKKIFVKQRWLSLP